MKMTIWETIASIPWWIYPLTAYCIYAQFTSLKTRVIELTQLVFPILIIISLMLCGLTLQLILQPGLLNLKSDIDLIGFLLAGLTLGYLQTKLIGIHVLPNKHQVCIPGSFFNSLIALSTLAALWFVRKHFGYIVNSPKISLWLYAGMIGLAVGRLTALTFKPVRSVGN